MQIEIGPETERIVREEINSGHFQSVDELITVAVRAWREKNATSKRRIGVTRQEPGRALRKLAVQGPQHRI